VSGWEAIGGVFQLTRHWSGLLGGDQGEARVGLPPLNCAVMHQLNVLIFKSSYKGYPHRVILDVI
jgi:hypothetical protein